MANLVKISEMLKSASDQQLASELNTPNATVPSYLVLSELQRRKKLRGSLMSPEPQTSVAEDMEMESSRANQMGIGGLQEPQGYAGGGEVRGYAAGGVALGDGWYQYGGIKYQIDPVTGMPVVDGIRTSPATIAQSAQSPWNTVGAPVGQGQDYKPSTKAFLNDPTLFMPQPAQSGAGRGAAEYTPPAAPLTGGKGAGKGRADTGGGLPTLGRATPATTSTAATETDDWGKQLKDLTNQYQGMYQKQADLMQKQADELKESKGSDAAMAAILAGLGIAGGKSQNAITNIAEGAIPGIQQYAASERERQKELQKLVLGQGALGIEQIGAQLKGAGMGAEYELGGRKAGAEEMKARAAMQSAANQGAYYSGALQQSKLANATDRVQAQNYQAQLKEANERLKDLTLDPQERAYWSSTAKNAMLGLQKLVPSIEEPKQNKLTGDAKSGYRYGY